MLGGGLFEQRPPARDQYDVDPVRRDLPRELQALLESVGFRVYRHLMVDVFPYPHVLYVGERLP